MKGYAQIYMNKKISEGNKIKNKTSKNLTNTSEKLSNDNNQNNDLKKNISFDKLSERNPSVITFSNLKTFNNKNNSTKISENIILNSEKNTKNNSYINNINNNNIIEDNRNRIRYRKKIANKNNSYNSNNNKIIINNEEEKNKEKIEHNFQKEQILSENKVGEYIEEENKTEDEINKLKFQDKIIKDKNNETIKSNKSILSEGNNNYIYEIKGINNSNQNNRYNDSIKENGKHKKNKNSSNFNEISMKSESSNNYIEANFNNNYLNHNNKFSTIQKIEETFESLNITKESNDKLLTKEQILYFTHIIFLNNATYIKNKGFYMMSKTNFLNILKSLNIIKSQLILVEIDLIYDSISGKSTMIIFPQFNQILIKIIQKIYQEQYMNSPQLTINYFINKLVQHYNLFFENKIPKDYLYKYQYNSIVQLIQILPNENQILILNQVILTINKIYEKYFIYEFDNNKEYLYKSSESLVNFCRDFEIIPKIINSTQAVTYYNLIIHIEKILKNFMESINTKKICKNKGKIFTLYHFLLFLMHMSLYSYTKLFGSKTWNNPDNDITKEAKLILFLEKLEHSKGMNNFLSKLYIPRTKSLSLIPPRDFFIGLGILEVDKKKIKIIESLGDIYHKEKKESEKEEEPLKEKEEILLEE